MSRKKGTSISIDKKVLEKAQKKIDALFSGNMSAYINFLIAKDNENIPVEITKPEVKTEIKIDESKKEIMNEKFFDDED